MVRKRQHVDTSVSRKSRRADADGDKWSFSPKRRSSQERTLFDDDDNEKDDNLPDSFFKRCVDNNGISISSTSCKLRLDHAIFIRNLSESIKNKSTSPREFMSSLTDFISDPSRLQLLLMPTESSMDANNSNSLVNSGPQDSLIRLLLSVDSIQTDLILRLLDGLVDQAENQKRSSVNASELIISQLRFLDHVVDCGKVSAKLKETLPLISPTIQESLIPCIPELLSSEYHRNAAIDLQELMGDNRCLTSCVLATLGRLHLDWETTQEARVAIIEELHRKAYKLEQLPEVISFLQETSKDVEVSCETYDELRQHLDLNVFSNDSVPSNLAGQPAAKRAKRDENSMSMGAQILRFLQSSARFPMKKHLGDGMMKLLDDLSFEDSEPFDVLLILVLLSCPNRKKKANKMLKHKILNEVFKPEHFGEILKYDLIRKQYLKSVIEIAENLLQSSEPIYAQFGSSLYKECFKISQGNQLDELVVGLVTHVGSFSDSEIKWALKTLKEMIIEYPVQMDNLSFYVTDLLGNLSDLSYENAKSVLEIVVDLGLKASDPADTTLEDLHRLINKKNMAACKKSRMIGLLGGLMLVKSLLPLVDTNSNKLDEAKKMISLLDIKTAENRNLRAIWFDELSEIFGQLSNGTTGTSVAVLMLEKFGGECAKLTSNLKKRRFDFETGVEFDLRISGETLPPVDMASLVMNSESDSVMILPPLLRLLTACSRLSPANITEIRWALVSPLSICNEDTIDDFDRYSTKSQMSICGILYHSSNWIREVLNSFGACSQISDSLLIARLKHMREIDRRLMICLKKIAVFCVPVLSLGYTDVQAPLIGKSVPKAGPGRKKKTEAASTQNNDNARSVTPENDEDLQSQAGPSNRPGGGNGRVGDGEKILPPEKISMFLRELDLELVLRLLTGEVVESSSKLSVKDVEFLLTDLEAKLKHGLPTRQKRPGRLPVSNDFAKSMAFQRLDKMETKSVARAFIKAIPSLMQHMILCKNRLQSIVENENESVMDTTLMLDSADSLLLQRSLELCFGCFITLLSWNGSAKDDVLEEILSKMMETCDLDDTDRMNLVERISWLIDFFCEYEKILPRLESSVALLKVMTSLTQLGKKLKCAVTDSKVKIREMAVRFLRKDWADDKTKGLTAAHLRDLLEVATPESSADILKLVEDLVKNGIETVVAESDATDQHIKTCSKANFPVFYQKTLALLVLAAKKLPDKKDMRRKEVRLECIGHWIIAIKHFVYCTTLLRESSLGTVPVLRSAMVESAKIVDLFTNSGLIRNFEENFQHSRDDIIKLVSTFQKATKTLQRLCNHVKTGKSGFALTKYVKTLRPALSAYVGRMSTIASFNKCEGAIRIGYMKPRDLQGQALPDSDAEDEEMGSVAGEGAAVNIVPDSAEESDDDSSDGENSGVTGERTRRNSGDSSVSQGY